MSIDGSAEGPKNVSLWGGRGGGGGGGGEPVHQNNLPFLFVMPDVEALGSDISSVLEL